MRLVLITNPMVPLTGSHVEQMHSLKYSHACQFVIIPPASESFVGQSILSVLAYDDCGRQQSVPGTILAHAPRELPVM